VVGALVAATLPAAWAPGIGAADAFADGRQGTVAFVVRTERSRITAREQSRFMLHVDRRLPARHREYGMRLLRTVVHTQRWGIAEVAPAGWALAFKGGWGKGPGRAHHQVALLQRGAERVSVAILTAGQGTHRYGTETLRGVAQRLLRRLGGQSSA